MSSIESFAAWGAPALLILAGYGLVWWTRLWPRLSSRLERAREHAPLRQAPHDR